MRRDGVPSATSPLFEARMKRQRRRDTAPEQALRSELWRRGLRYRVDVAVFGRRRVDIVFSRPRVAVFVDGCFWHGCPRHATSPKSNGAWWRDKLDKNVERDRTSDYELGAAGWRVLRVWEHEDPKEAADRIEAAIRCR